MAMGQAGWHSRRHLANNLFLLIFNPAVAAFFLDGKTGGAYMAHEETELMLKGYGLTTAEMFYHMPDHPHVLNTFVWQDYDLAPDHPRLFDFIEFWQEEIEGPLHSVRFTHRKLIRPGEWRNVVGELTLH
jgi:uncharacterized protein Usg